jgi:hypothetical protein
MDSTLNDIKPIQTILSKKKKRIIGLHICKVRE